MDYSKSGPAKGGKREPRNIEGQTKDGDKAATTARETRAALLARMKAAAEANKG